MNQEELTSEVEQELVTPSEIPVVTSEVSSAPIESLEAMTPEEDIPEWLRGVSTSEAMMNSESKEEATVATTTSSDMSSFVLPEENASVNAPASFEIEEVGDEPKKRPAKKPMKKPMKKPDDKARLTPDVPVNPSDGDLPEWLK